MAPNQSPLVVWAEGGSTFIVCKISKPILKEIRILNESNTKDRITEKLQYLYQTPCLRFQTIRAYLRLIQI